MREPGDLVHTADYAFGWRALEPRPEAPSALLVLLHGVDGDEFQLAAIGARMPADTLVALPRGPRSISGGRIGWYRMGLSEDGPQVVEEEAEDSLSKLAAFVGQLQQRFDVPPSRTWLAGFSQGGMLAASLALTGPECVAGMAMVSGRLCPEDAPRVAAASRLAHLQALVMHGRDDTTLPLDDGLAAASRLRELGVRTELRVHAAGHCLAASMADDVVAWLTARLAPDAPQAPRARARGPAPHGCTPRPRARAAAQRPPSD